MHLARGAGLLPSILGYDADASYFCSLSQFHCVQLARGQGLEPRFPGPEPGVLPLDDPRKKILYHLSSKSIQNIRYFFFTLAFKVLMIVFKIFVNFKFYLKFVM